MLTFSQENPLVSASAQSEFSPKCQRGWFSSAGEGAGSRHSTGWAATPPPSLSQAPAHLEVLCLNTAILWAPRSSVPWCPVCARRPLCVQHPLCPWRLLCAQPMQLWGTEVTEIPATPWELGLGWGRRGGGQCCPVHLNPNRGQPRTCDPASPPHRGSVSPQAVAAE